jgi:hypothetical protein
MLHGVISTFNNDPRYLTKFFESYSIYDQSTDGDLAKELLLEFPKLKVTKNSGHSLSHYFAYIIENYENLPSYLVFLKSNVVPRHMDEKTFNRCMDLARLESGYVSFFNDENFVDKIRIAYHVYPGLFLERNNSWYMKRLESRYFSDYNQLLSFIFENPVVPEFVPFTPGACFGISSNQIRNIPIEVWRFLEEISTYKFFPSEAFLVERILFTLFNAPYEFQYYFLNGSEEWQEQLESFLKKRMATKSREKNVTRLKSNRHLYKFVAKLESKLRFELDSRF